jgi:DNA-binding winged helix-turn-helix (wHTH) protein
VLAFGSFELQPERHCLLQAGEAVAIGTRAFDVLLAPAERSAQVVTKSELLDLV